MPLEPRPYKLDNTIQHYAWGAKSENAFIPRLIGLEPKPDTPYAELWIGAHPKAPSRIEMDEKWMPLTDVIATDPEGLLGVSVVQQFGKNLPFLFKVLSASEALSIQAHPDKKQAEILHSRDPVHYPDENHKPEIAVALDGLTALVGFKSTGELLQTCLDIPEIIDFAGLNLMEVFRQSPEVALRQFYSTLMRRALAKPEALDAAINRLQSRLVGKDALSETESLFLELRAKYPGPDIGLFSIFILNLVHLKPCEGVFLGAGIPHAYLKGNIVECMANSDNVVRAGLTPKFKDVEALVEILTYESGTPGIYHPDLRRLDTIYDPPVEEFRLVRSQLSAIDFKSVETESKIQILLVTEGKLLVSWNTGMDFGQREFAKGETVLIPARMRKYHIKSVTDTQFFTVQVP